MRLVGGVEIEKSMVPHLSVAIKNKEGYLNCGDPPMNSEESQSNTKFLAQISSARK